MNTQLREFSRQQDPLSRHQKPLMLKNKAPIAIIFNFIIIGCIFKRLHFAEGQSRQSRTC